MTDNKFTFANLGNRKLGVSMDELKATIPYAIIDGSRIHDTFRKAVQQQKEAGSDADYAMLRLINNNGVILAANVDTCWLMTVDSSGMFVFEEIADCEIEAIKPKLHPDNNWVDIPKLIVEKFDPLLSDEMKDSFARHDMLAELGPYLIRGNDVERIKTAIKSALTERGDSFNGTFFEVKLQFGYSALSVLINPSDNDGMMVQPRTDGGANLVALPDKALLNKIRFWMDESAEITSQSKHQPNAWGDIAPNVEESVAETIDPQWDQRLTYKLIAANAAILAEMSPKEFHNSSIAADARTFLRSIISEAGL